MKKLYVWSALMLLSAASFAQNFPVDFEPSGNGANWTWTTFESGTVPPDVEFVANPDPSGINTSATVAKFYALDSAQAFAGCETQHGADVGTFSLSTGNAMIKMMVYKNKISDVGLKLVTSNNASLGVIKVSNTVINTWEELTFDFSNFVGHNTINTYDQIVVFPDWETRSEEDTIYFDNIGWGGCTSSTANISVNNCNVYTLPSGTVVNSDGYYQDVLPNGNTYGCDSIINVNLETPSIMTYEIRTCGAYVAPSGAIFPSTGVYYDTVTSGVGCKVVSQYDVTITVADETVTPGQSVICASGSNSTTIDLASSGIGTFYTLRDDANDAVIDGPIAGTGGPISFNTGAISTTTTYNIYTEKDASLGECLSFDGIDDYVGTTTNISANSYDKLTFEAWVYPTQAYNGTRQTIFTHGNDDQRGLFIQGGTSRWFVNVGPGAYWATATVDNNQWQHIAVVYDQSNDSIQFFKNGVEYTEPFPAYTSFSNSGGQLYFGTHNGAYPFRGKIDDVKIWSKQMTGAEVLEVMDTCVAINNPELVAYYKFNEGEGAITTADASSNGNHGTLGSGPGAPAWEVGHDTCKMCASEFSQLTTVTYSTCAAIEENEFAKEINIYPNPTSGNFAIEFNDLQEKVTVRLLPLSGQIIEQHVFMDSDRVQLGMNHPAGIYLVEIENQDASKATFRLIKD